MRGYPHAHFLVEAERAGAGIGGHFEAGGAVLPGFGERVHEQRLRWAAAALVGSGGQPCEVALVVVQLQQRHRHHLTSWIGDDPQVPRLEARTPHDLGLPDLERVPLRCDHSRKASSLTMKAASQSASVAARTANPAGSGRSGITAPSGSCSTQLVHRTR